MPFNSLDKCLGFAVCDRITVVLPSYVNPHSGEAVTPNRINALSSKLA